MIFRTELTPKPLGLNLTYATRMLSLGSCFADHMGQRMQDAKFDLVVNPLGISFHPLSVARLITYALDEKLPEVRFAPHLEQWHSFSLHSQANDVDQHRYIQNATQAFQRLNQRLKTMDVLFLTFGTAIGYERLDSGELVNNNHRYPLKEFRQLTTAPDEIAREWGAIMDRLKKLRPALRIVLTVSPVRHVRHTLPGNSLSKASLRWACHLLAERNEVFYFPAYELLLDDLRDYRFFGRDLIHPSEEAQQYIWEKWKSAAMTAETLELETRWEACKRDLGHRPFNPKSEAHRKFLERLKQNLYALSVHLPVQMELQRVSAELSNWGSNLSK